MVTTVPKKVGGSLSLSLPLSCLVVASTDELNDLDLERRSVFPSTTSSGDMGTPLKTGILFFFGTEKRQLKLNEKNVALSSLVLPPSVFYLFGKSGVRHASLYFQLEARPSLLPSRADLLAQHLWEKRESEGGKKREISNCLRLKFDIESVLLLLVVLLLPGLVV